MLFVAFFISLPASIFSLTCVSCPFKLELPHSLSCTDTCQGDVCYIVVNEFYNGTVIAGCLTASTADFVHKGTAVCHKKGAHTLCACTSGDKCNDPKAPLAKFEFTEDEILEGQQIFPQIQPTESLPETATQKKTEPQRVSAEDQTNKNMTIVGSTISQAEKTIIPILLGNRTTAKSSPSHVTTMSPSSGTTTLGTNFVIIVFNFLLLSIV